MTPTARHHRRRFRRILVPLVAVASLAGLAAACAPPANPSWVKVRWVRDAGGTSDPNTGYMAAFERWVTKGGTTTGPTSVTPPDMPDPFRPLLESPYLPDGTARFPWNGYAGEGITVTANWTGPSTEYVATYPGGTCDIGSAGPDWSTRSITPSPDGQKMATITRLDFLGGGSEYTVSVRSLGATTCPTITSVQYSPSAGSDPRPGNQIVWATNSDAIIFAVFPGPGATGASMMRLNATAGSTPVAVISPAEGCTTPLGWSVENRLLMSCGTLAGLQSRLVTVPIFGGGTTNVIDTSTRTPDTLGFLHFGYYQPGTNTIVFNKAVPVTNSDGLLQAWTQIHTVYDLPGATSAPLRGSPPPLVWHQAPRNGEFMPPYAMTDVPNQEFIERFVR